MTDVVALLGRGRFLKALSKLDFEAWRRPAIQGHDLVRIPDESGGLSVLSRARLFRTQSVAADADSCVWQGMQFLPNMNSRGPTLERKAVRTGLAWFILESPTRLSIQNLILSTPRGSLRGGSLLQAILQSASCASTAPTSAENLIP